MTTYRMDEDRMDEEGAATEATGEDDLSLEISAAKYVVKEEESSAMRATDKGDRSLEISAAKSLTMDNTQARKYRRRRACLSLLGITVAEKMVYYGLFGNIVVCLSQVFHLDVTSAVKNVNNIIGASTVAALVGSYIADAHLGSYWTIVTFFTAYLLGLLSLTVFTSQPSLRPISCSLGSEDCKRPTKGQLRFFLFCVYLTVIGTSANPCYQALGGDQFDDQSAEERKQKASYFNWLFLAMCFGSFLAYTIAVYIEENVSWKWAFAILTICMLVALITFVVNTSNYRESPSSGSPFTRLAQVLVAAARNWTAKLPSDHQDLYEAPDQIMNEKSTRTKLLHTNFCGFLDRAAICHDKSENMSRGSPWRLCTVTQVEEVKLVVRIMPIWITCLMFAICFAQLPTFFIKQAGTMDRHLGSFHVPSASLLSFGVLFSCIFMAIYERILVPYARRYTNNIRGITILQRIGTGLVLGTFSMVAAALAEKKRLSVVRKLNLMDSPSATTPITVFWQLPQNAFMGIAIDFTLAGLQEFFYDQLPDSMRSWGIALYMSLIGMGNFLSTMIVTFVVSVTGRGSDHHHSWIVDNLNRARLDKYFWTLAIASITNFCIYLAVANWYTYKQLPRHHSTQKASAQQQSSV